MGWIACIIFWNCYNTYFLVISYLTQLKGRILSLNINNKKQLSDPDIIKKYSALVFERQELSQPHNPYDQEIRECASIENGDMEMFRKSISENYTGKLGTL